MQNYDIIIAGSGLNGLLLANILEQHGMNVAILDRRPSIEDPARDDQRVTTISLPTYSTLSDLGIIKKTQDYICPIHHIYTFEDGTQPILEITNEKDQSNALGYAITAGRLLSALYHNLERATILMNTECSEIEGGDFHCTVNQSLRAKLLLVADGKSSQIAQKLQIDKRITDYNQDGIVFNIQHHDPHNNIAVEQFTPLGPIASLPTYQNNQSGIVWSLRRDIAKHLATLPNQEFLDYLREYTGRFRHFGTITSLTTQRSSYQLRHSVLKRRYDQRVFFMGDSYHSIHPVAGQGFNMSVNDIVKVSQAIAQHHNRGIDFGFRVHLEDMSRNTCMNNLTMGAITHGLTKLYSNRNPMLKFARTLGLDVANQISPLKDALRKHINN